MRLPLCDYCGAAVALLGEALVQWRFDGDGLLIELGVVHAVGRGCTYRERVVVGRFAEIPAASFAERVDVLRVLARAHDGASVTRAARVLERLRRLAGGPDVRKGPLP